MAVRQIFSADPGHPPARQPRNPSAAIPFPARCPAGVWRVLMSAAPLSLWFIIRKPVPLVKETERRNPPVPTRRIWSLCQRPAALLPRTRGLPKANPQRRANALRPSKSNETGWRLPRAAGTQQKRHLPQQMSFLLEQVKGVEPSYQAWEACVLPMNYTCVETLLSIAHPGGKGKRKLCLCHISLERGFLSNKAETCNCRSLPLCHGKSVRV